MADVMMKCGHAANAQGRPAGDPTAPMRPSCCICGCFEQADAPDLTGRRARCGYYGAVVPRRTDERHGPDRGKATCQSEVDSALGLAFFSHHPDKPFDQYYCGCFGWD
jgi:hypothetical protein